MALHTRQDTTHADTRIHTRRLVPTSRPGGEHHGHCRCKRNKAIVGQNAFAHEAGIHQDGMLKERTTYEIMQPEDVGFSMSDLVLGKAQRTRRPGDRAKAMGYSLSREQIDNLFEQFKVLADKKKEIYDADIGALIEQQIHAISEKWTARLVQGDLRHGPGARGDAASASRRREVDRQHGLRRRPDRRESSWPSRQVTGITVVCKDSASTASRSARTPKARFWCKWNTTARCTAAAAFRPTASSASAKGVPQRHHTACRN